MSRNLLVLTTIERECHFVLSFYRFNVLRFWNFGVLKKRRLDSAFSVLKVDEILLNYY